MTVFHLYAFHFTTDNTAKCTQEGHSRVKQVGYKARPLQANDYPGAGSYSDDVQNRTVLRCITCSAMEWGFVKYCLHQFTHNSHSNGTYNWKRKINMRLLSASNFTAHGSRVPRIPKKNTAGWRGFCLRGGICLGAGVAAASQVFWHTGGSGLMNHCRESPTSANTPSLETTLPSAS